ncbi:glycoside hydrolase family 1 protein [Candidatus Parcubacteria bacterium]|nr:glycoside hydrolase family 1 protein [Candidatus Parcubacteria bacterium]
MGKEKILKFPDGFLWGTATSAYQIEGGIVNDWSEWEKSEARIKKLKENGLNPDDFICGQACDSYNRYEEDIKLVKNLNCAVYRFSIEWARVEPEEGEFNNAALNHYRDIILELREKGIEPFLTLNHYTLPVWVSEIGGWENKKAINYFLQYVEKIIQELGNEVKFWLTFNEPQMSIGYGYVSGEFPPQVKNLFRANKVFKNLMLAHQKAYKLIHEKLGENAKVSIAHNLIYYTAYSNNLLNNLIVKLLSYINSMRFVKAAEPCQDFIALQYYHHNRMKFALGGKFIIAKVENKSKELTDMGWEIYPKGIYYLLKALKKYKKPIYITENGLSDEKDNKRVKFITDNLKYIHKAIQEGVDVRGYFYWSLFDNFEWAYGWQPKFGLYAVDRKTFKRTARPSAKVYAEICRTNKVIYS